MQLFKTELSGVGRVSRGVRVAALMAASLGAMALPMTASAQLVTNYGELQRIARESEAQYNQFKLQSQIYAASTGSPTVVDLGGGQRLYLTDFMNGRPVYSSTHELRSAQTIAANRVWPGGDLGLGLTGAGVRVGVWDDGIPTHSELAGRVTVMDGTTFQGWHTIGVSGQIAAAGINPDARGIAYRALIEAYYAFGGDEQTVAAAAGDLNQSNHSYGIRAGWSWGARGDGRWVWLGDETLSMTKDATFGFYGPLAQRFDQIAFNAPFYTMVWSSGNQRLDGPESEPVEHWVWRNGDWELEAEDVRGSNGIWDTMAGAQMMKNGLTVGAIPNIFGGWTDPSDVRLASFSSNGPVDDGRVKPDIVAPGEGIFLPAFGDSYGLSDGTSFSSPAVAGGLALLQQTYQSVHNAAMPNALMRALVAHTAFEAGTDPGPDYNFGWGVMNVGGAAEQIQLSEFSDDVLFMRRLQSAQTIQIPVFVAEEGQVKVTIAWNDPAGVVNTLANDDRTPSLVNDVDLRVIENETGDVFEPWTLNPDAPTEPAIPGDNDVDNIEQVWIEFPVPGQYTVEIEAPAPTVGGSVDVGVVITAPVGDAIRSVTITPTEVVGGRQNAVGTVTIDAPAEEPTVIQLASSNVLAAQVPTSVTVPAGEDSAQFDIISGPVRNLTTVTINAVKEGGKGSGQIDVLPIGLATFALAADSVTGGNTVDATLTLNESAPSTGAAVVVRSTKPRVARGQRNWVIVRPGQSEATFKVRTRSVGDPQDVVISVSRADVTLSDDLRVDRPGLRDEGGIELSANTVKSGGTVTGRVFLDGPASQRGAIVTLSASPSGVVTIPVRVEIVRGRVIGTFTVTAGTVSEAKQVTITAERFGEQASTTLTVQP